jgi:hypothetical protein
MSETMNCPEGVQRVARWLAAQGHPQGVFRLQPDDLKALTGAPVADVVVTP